MNRVEVIVDSIRKVLKQMLTENIGVRAMIQYYSKCSTLLQTEQSNPLRDGMGKQGPDLRELFNAQQRHNHIAPSLRA